MNILITNIFLTSRTGTELYVRDLAMELKREGHRPAVYTPIQGPIADELKASGVAVCSNLLELPFRPHVIHGHHRIETLTAVLRYTDIPAIFICHDYYTWYDNPPLHPRIRRYFGVSLACMQRLREATISEKKIGLMLNFVDLKRFLPRSPLPQYPRRALVFSNYATNRTHLPAIIEACRRTNLGLDVVGAGVGNSISQPEDILGKYDIVFAKAKAAMEAMAVGTAVILCDFTGVGPMVTSAEFDYLRRLNFGFKALREPLHPENIMRQISRYDAQDALRVSELLRSNAGLKQAVQKLIAIYQEVIEAQKKYPAQETRWRDHALVFRLALRAKMNMWNTSAWHYLHSFSNVRGISRIKKLVKSIILKFK
ncbi:MAG: hypothetical protein A2Z19_07370 [Deltaproteobacteria bacterium RBG_16_54_18]|nr:MAG: hypothetical protein A2Z19_07370 [Deltaproteobacteria bacterium RBG_16_54_18]